ncbi:MAG: T9SS type A sorting domain-containing protein, partial [Bacteroidota bacterium]
FDELRIDAVKHIDPAFLAKFLVETAPGEQAFAVGEFFDTNAATLAWYQNTVVDHMNSGDKPAQMSIFDFELRADMQAVLNDGSGGADLFNELGYSGLVWGQGEAGTEVVTFLDNHDKDRIGFIGGSAQVNGECPPGEIKAGNSCLIVAGENAPDHDPIVNDKEDMGYPLLMAAEGRPTIFWKDWFWFDLASEIEWLIPLRGLMATGGSFNSTQAAADGDPSNDPFWDPAFGGNNGGGNLFAMMRWGSTSGTQDGMVLGLNDHPTDSLGMWVSTPFSSRFLKDYSDGFLFEPNQAFLDSRALIRAKGRDYSWWGLTGQYPHPPRIAPAIFSMDAEPGGSVHYVILDRDEVANFQVNGAPLAVGDQVAIRNAAGEICGLGRVGQAFGWSADHDMLIEVLGPFPIDTDPVGGAANGMAVGESFELLVWDASENEVFRASSLSFAAVGTSGTFDALRPQTPGRPAQLTQPLITDASGTFQHAAITRLTAMVADERVDDIPLSLPTPSQTYAPFEVQLRPNPASELVRVQLETQVSASLQLTCLSLTGRTVWEQRLFAPAHQEQEVAFAVQSWPKGVYLLRVSDGDHTHIEKVLVR